ncbi:DNA directed RNA polymerase subunit L [Hokovirus HKV1]|uniref:DNA directed RNA polymerase subunit L n=1 Tax=Hokovirus HKV1 TaxID=1977638 RepID=A0A1V0SG14_9VIRU|nr:DNA directed RNA polymerase subunit L [Hokovirus HKV1]
MSKLDIQIKQKEKVELIDLETSMLHLQISGKDVNCTIVNTMRRIAYDYIPTYAFCKESIKIEKNTSKITNDQLRLKISQIGYPGFIFKHLNFSNDILILPEKYWKNVDFTNKNRPKYEKDKKKIEMYINVKNNSHEQQDITSNNVVFYENGEKITYPYKPSPYLILKLNPNEQCSLHAIAELGIGKNNAIWSAASNVYYKQLAEDETSYDFYVESAGQYDEYVILIKSCQIIIEKLNQIKDIISKNYNTSEISEKDSIKLILTGEEHTLGQLINRALQDHDEVIFSGVSIMDLFIDEVTIKLRTKNNNPMIVIFDRIDYLVKLYEHIMNILIKLSK